MPFGPLAFFPGHLSHTNELLVLLGDNLFLECTASRAHRICQGRLDVLKQKTARVKEEQQRVRERMEAGEALLGVGQPQLNEDGDEIVEIQEEYKEEVGEEEKGDEDTTSSSAPTPLPPASSLAASPMSDAEFHAHWDRLAELEEEEEKRAQQSKAAPKATRRPAPQPSQPVRTVEEAEAENAVALPAIRSPADIYAAIKARKEQHERGGDSSSDAHSSEQHTQPVPHAKHAKQVSFSPTPSIALIDPVSTRPLRHHAHSPPPPAASLLPHSSSASSPSFSPPPPSSSSIVPPSSNPALLSAFTGAVRERVVDAPTPAHAAAAAAPVPKKMSRFMAQRLGIPFEEG